MAKNFVMTGDVLTHTPTVARASGEMILIGTKVAVCLADIPANTPGSVAASDVFTVPKLSTDAVTQGAALYWDNTNRRLTTTASGNTYAGYAAAAAASGVTTVAININR